MKLIRFEHAGLACVGLVHADRVFDVARHLPDLRRLPDALAPAARQRLAGLPEAAHPDHRLADVRLLNPIEAGSRIFCIGVNYRDHASEVGRTLPARPSSFLRTQESLVPPGAPIVRPAASDQLDYEGELAVVIGVPVHRIARADALSAVAGYTCFNDGSVRDYQKHSVTAGKNFDRSGSCGPWVVTADAIPDPAALTLVTRLNGVEVQRCGTDRLIYDVPLIISFLSEITTLKPGDLIATGTPAGVGAGRTPPLWMKPDDRVEVEISAIGILANPVEAEG